MSQSHPALRELLSFRPWFPEVDLAAFAALWKTQAWPELCSGSLGALEGVLHRVAGRTGASAGMAPSSIPELEAVIRSRGIPLPDRIEKAMGQVASLQGKTRAEAGASLDALLLVMRWAKANLPDPGLWAKTTPLAKGVALGLVVICLAGGAVASMAPGNQTEEKKAVVVEPQPPRQQKEPAPAAPAPEAPRPAKTRQPKAPAPAQVAAATDPQPTRKLKEPPLGSDLSSLDPWDRGIVEEARKLRLEGMEKEAIERMTEVLQRNPHDPTLLYELAITFRMVGDLDETRALLVRSCKAGEQRACKQVQGPPPARLR